TPGAFEKTGQCSDHLAGKALPQGVPRPGDKCLEAWRIRLAFELPGHALRRDQAAVEVRVQSRRHLRGHLDLVGDHLRQVHRLQVARLPLDRDDLVAELAVTGALSLETGVRILPVELLHWEIGRGLPWPFGKGLATGEGRQWCFEALVVNAVDRKAHAGGGPGLDRPGDRDYVVVCESNGVVHPQRSLRSPCRRWASRCSRAIVAWGCFARRCACRLVSALGGE